MKELGVIGQRLSGGLWHMTHPDRFIRVMASEALLVEPRIPDAQRWKTSRGADYHPFVRKLGGVSLFDFGDFDPDAYEAAYPLSNWRTFVPHPDDWGSAVWIELDRRLVSNQFLSKEELVNQWKAGKHFRHTFMPRLEACCLGDVPATSFKSAFLTWSGGAHLLEIGIQPFMPDHFKQLLVQFAVPIQQ